MTLGDKVEDLALTVAEFGEDLWLGSWTDAGEVVYELDGDAGLKIASPLPTATMARSISL